MCMLIRDRKRKRTWKEAILIAHSLPYSLAQSLTSVVGSHLASVLVHRIEYSIDTRLSVVIVLDVTILLELEFAARGLELRALVEEEADNGGNTEAGHNGLNLHGGVVVVGVEAGENIRRREQSN